MTENPEVDKLVDEMAAPLIEAFERQRQQTAKFLSQNRRASKRMNRPEKLSRMEKGASIIFSLLERSTVK